VSNTAADTTGKGTLNCANQHNQLQYGSRNHASDNRIFVLAKLAADLPTLETTI